MKTSFFHLVSSRSASLGVTFERASSTQRAGLVENHNKKARARFKERKRREEKRDAHYSIAKTEKKK